ncbi:MAG: GNAT family N-acetyltransferase [Bacteroidetes bacterium]|nr:GNAT family N-acetyltransferase [Bacteroidota bacterium]
MPHSPVQDEVPETIETSRLILRKPRIDDAEDVFEAYASDPEVTLHLTWRTHTTVDETRDYIRQAIAGWEKSITFTWVITLKPTGRLIGSIDIRLETNANVGYVLARRYWNMGYMTEAVAAVVAWALQMDEIYRAWAVCDVENVASARVLEKAGLEREGILRRWIVLPNKSGKPRDCVCYSKVK